jgi:hypothetical protein
VETRHFAPFAFSRFGSSDDSFALLLLLPMFLPLPLLLPPAEVIALLSDSWPSKGTRASAFFLTRGVTVVRAWEQ